MSWLATIRRTVLRPSGMALVAALLVASALMDTLGDWGPGPMVEVTIATIAVVWAARRARRGAESHDPSELGDLRRFYGVLVAAFAVHAGIKAIRDPPVLALLALAGATLATELAPVRRAVRRVRLAPERLRLPVVFACIAAIVLLNLRDKRVWIDVWTFQQQASSALVHGENPYSKRYHNIYRDLVYYSPAVADERWVYAFPYPPQTIFADLPSFALLRDVRYTSAAALFVAAYAMNVLAPPGLGHLAAAAVLLEPHTWKVMRAGWTEPTVLAPMLLLLLALRRFGRLAPRGWLAAGIAAGIAAGSKQYTPVLLLPLIPALPATGRARAVLVAAGVATAIVLPFAIWDLRGLWNGVAAMQFHQPFRLDSLSLQVALVKLGLGRPPSSINFVLAAGTAALTWPSQRSLAQGLACGTASYLVFVVTAKQAFLNYYWLGLGLLLALPLLLAAQSLPQGRRN